MKALILAAGRGSRLGHHTADKPKSLLKIGERSLIERSIQNLLDAGCQEVMVVVGYQHHMLEEIIGEKFPAHKCKTILNPDYTRGSGSSFIVAAEEIDGEMMIIESDLLYDVGIVKRIAAQKNKNIFAKGTFGHDRNEIKIRLKDGFVASAEWGPPDSQADGDWVGFTRLSSEGSKILREVLQNTNPDQGKEINYEDFLIGLLGQIPYEPVDINDLPWIEIDNEEDLRKAENNIYPRIAANLQNP